MLAPEIRAALPAEAHAYLAAVEAQVRALQTQVSSLQSQVEALTARLNQTSHNSARPPSSDPPSAPAPPAKSGSGRKAGGQPGHKGQQRRWLAEAELSGIETHRPTHCCGCGNPLPADAAPTGETLAQQVWELPPIQPEVIEHRFPALCCPHCQTISRAARPAQVPPGAFGPQVGALVAVLNGRYRLSKRDVQALMGEVFGVDMSLGSVVALSEQVGVALHAAYAEVQTVVAQQPHANLDETSWQEAAQRRWLTQRVPVAVTTVATLFYLAASRAGREVAHLVGQAYAGVVGSDRYSAYRQFAVAQRQLCWAHLKRDLVACSERSGETGAWGKRALAVVAQLFALWHRFKQGEIDRATLQAQMHPLQTDFHALLLEGQTLPSWSKAQPFCNDLLRWEPALWTFLVVAGVEPTNNAAERALRPAVLWRKGCFGSRSQAGLRFTEAILTVTATCRQQQRPLLPFLSDSLAAHWAGQQAPSLFPTP